MTQINGDAAVLLRYLQEHHPDINIPQDTSLNRLLDIMERVQAPLPNPKPAPTPQVEAKSAAEASKLWRDWVELEIHVAMKVVGKFVSEECAAIERKIAALDAKVKALEATTSEQKTEEWWQLQQLHDQLSGRAEFIKESRSNA
jgi:hypothetical protein